MEQQKKKSPVVPILIGVVVLGAVAACWFGKQKSDRINAERVAQARAEIAAKKAAAKAEADAEKAKKEEARRKAEEEANRPPDKYDWMRRYKDHKRIHMTIDCTRCENWTIQRILSQRMPEFVFKEYKGRVKANAHVLELNDEALENANVLFCSLGSGDPYDDAERAVIKRFLERGGFVFVCGESELHKELVKTYGLELEQFVTDESPHGFSKALEETCIENCDNCKQWVARTAGSNWYPLAGWDDEEGHAALACRDIGKGRILWASMNFMIADTDRGHNWNLSALAKVFDGIANAGIQVKYEDPFRDRKLSAASVKVAGEGFTVYARESMKKSAERAKDDLAKLLPVIENALGVAYDKEDRCYVMAKSRYSEGEWCRTRISDDTPMRMLPYLSDDSATYATQLDGMTQWFAKPWDRSWTDCYYWNNYFHNALSAIVAKRAGYDQEGNAKIKKIMAEGKKYDPDLRHYSWGGKALQGGADLREGLVQVREAKTCAILLMLLKEDPDVVAKYYARLKELAERRKLVDDFTMDKMAAVYSDVLKKDMFPLFAKFGIQLDPQKGKFEGQEQN